MSGDNYGVLSKRQADVGRLIIDGKKSHEIGALLNISPRTVEAHIRAIKSNLCVGSRAQMVVKLEQYLDTQRTNGRRTNTNVPLERTRLIGRETEVADVERALRRHRLVTLAGSPGVGKTRLALAVAEALTDAFDDGVWLIELASLRGGDHFPATVARIMGLVLEGKAEPLAALTRALAPKRALLIFDNCEHVVDAIARVVASILEQCPHMYVLTTTRQRLRIAGEQLHPVSPLSTPDAMTLVTVDCAARSPAIMLFVERATAVDRGFVLSGENAAAIGEICRRLDGIPLAIELAAARVSVLRPQQIRDMLAQRFRLLTGGRRDAFAHHETLQAAIDWSHQILNDFERMLFRRLAILGTNWTSEAARAITADQPEADVQDAIASLVDKSLVIASYDNALTRFRMLDSVREYANEKLSAANERERIADRHLAYYRTLFVNAEAEYVRTIDQRTIMALAADLENARLALDWAIGTKRADLGAELFATTSLWYLCGLHDEASSLAHALLAINERGDTRLNALLWGKVALAAYGRGDIDGAHTAALQAADDARLCGDPLQRGIALGRYAHMAGKVRYFDAANAAMNEADVAFAEVEATGKSALIYRCGLLEARGGLEMLSGDLDRAAATYQQLASLHRSLGNRRAEIVSSYDLARVQHARGDTVRAIHLVNEALSCTERYMAPEQQHSVDDVRAYLLTSLAAFLAEADDAPGASNAACLAILLLSRSTMVVRVAQAIEVRALALFIGGRPESAALLAGYSFARLREASVTLEYTEERTNRRLVDLLDKRFTQDELARLLTQGEACSQNEAIAAALLTES